MSGTTPNVDLTIVANHIDMRESVPGAGRGPIGMSIQATRGTVCANILNNISHWYPVSLVGGGMQIDQSGDAVFSLERGSELIDAPAGAVLEANNPPRRGPR